MQVLEMCELKMGFAIYSSFALVKIRITLQGAVVGGEVVDDSTYTTQRGGSLRAIML